MTERTVWQVLWTGQDGELCDTVHASEAGARVSAMETCARLGCVFAGFRVDHAHPVPRITVIGQDGAYTGVRIIQRTLFP